MALVIDSGGYKFRNPVTNPKFIFRNFPYGRSLRSKAAALPLPKAEGNRAPREQTLPTLLLALLKAQEEMCRASKSHTENQSPRARGTSDIWSTPGLSINFMHVHVHLRHNLWLGTLKNVLTCWSVHILIKSARFEHAKLKILSRSYAKV